MGEDVTAIIVEAPCPAALRAAMLMAGGEENEYAIAAHYLERGTVMALSVLAEESGYRQARFPTLYTVVCFVKVGGMNSSGHCVYWRAPHKEGYEMEIPF